MYGEYWTATVEAMLDGDRGGQDQPAVLGSPPGPGRSQVRETQLFATFASLAKMDPRQRWTASPKKRAIECILMVPVNLNQLDLLSKVVMRIRVRLKA